MVDGQPAKISLVKNNVHDEVPVVLKPCDQEADLAPTYKPSATCDIVKPLHFEPSVGAQQYLGSCPLALNQMPQQ